MNADVSYTFMFGAFCFMAGAFLTEANVANRLHRPHHEIFIFTALWLLFSLAALSVIAFRFVLKV